MVPGLNSKDPMKGSGTLKTRKLSQEFTFTYQYTLKYIRAYGGNTYEFQIWEPGHEAQDRFSFQLRIMENGNDLKVVDLFGDNSNYYLGKGISIAIILEAMHIFNKRIISEHDGGWPAAREKVWERMRLQGLADYDITNKYYFTVMRDDRDLNRI